MFQSNDPKVRAIQAEMKSMLDATKDAAFKEFMDMPHVRFMTSLIPQPDNPDTLNSLMRSTFESGFQNGQSAAMIMMMEKMMGELEKALKKHGGT